ncbi:MAG TPA: acetyl-CoA carboxylase [Kiloniellales bacterium]|nr:acetyl-CoA carboxylase [Kiloniellales bacterium]
MPKLILSHLPGTFYRKPAPDKPPYKQEGDKVAPGDVCGLIEVMKSFHEVLCEEHGRILRFLVENEAAVQAGDPLAELE